MITVTLENLSQERDADFRSWLSKGPFRTLIEVLEAQENTYFAEAFNHALKADGSNLKLDAANESIAKSQQYHTFIETLKEFHDRLPTKPFQTSKVTSHA